MSKITKTQIWSILSSCKKIEDEKEGEFSNNKIAELYVGLDLLLREVKEYKDLLKKHLMKRKIKVEFVEEFDKKVLLEKGKFSTSYDVKKIFKELKKENKETDFLKIVNIIKSKIDKNDILLNEIVNHNSKKIPGEKTIKILKMSKTDKLVG